MAKTSILVEDMTHCMICGKPYPQLHHVIYGVANRKISDKYGYFVPLCMEHHTGSTGVHHNRLLDIQLKQYAQEHFESHYGTRKEFITIFGKSYL